MVLANFGITSRTILALILCLTSPVHLQIWGGDVITSSGVVQGITTYHNGAPLRTYLGVPFAKPPVGELRFKKPLPAEFSPTPITANKNPPACIQHSELPIEDLPVSEDCLYLNIWVPMSASKCNKKSVMFWIFGGGFTIGSIGQDVYIPRALASEGDIIFVAPNYRLGVLGFLYAGNPDSDAPGNQALYDVLEALKWTHKNIEAFGGDPDKITISGQSAGADVVSLLCVSPLAKGYFKRAIMESGACTNLYSDDQSMWDDLSQKIAKTVGCSTDAETIKNNTKKVVSCLRARDAVNLTRVMDSANSLSASSYHPNFGDSFLPRNPKEAVMSGDFTDVDILCGSNQDEGSIILPMSHPDVFGMLGEKDPKINKTYGRELMLDILKMLPHRNRDQAVNYYLGNLGEYDYDEIRRQVYTSFGDLDILCPTIYFAEKFAENGNKVYFYFFKHRFSHSSWGPWMGVTHFDEVDFVFGVPLVDPKKYSCSEIRLSREMIKMWSNFVKYGNPTYKSFTWPMYSRSSPRYVGIDTKGKSTGLGPHRNNCEFYRPYIVFE